MSFQEIFFKKLLLILFTKNNKYETYKFLVNIYQNKKLVMINDAYSQNKEYFPIHQEKDIIISRFRINVNHEENYNQSYND